MGVILAVLTSSYSLRDLRIERSMACHASGTWFASVLVALTSVVFAIYVFMVPFKTRAETGPPAAAF